MEPPDMSAYLLAAPAQHVGLKLEGPASCSVHLCACLCVFPCLSSVDLTQTCAWERTSWETEPTDFRLLARSRGSTSGLDEEFQIFADPRVVGDSAVLLDPWADSSAGFHKSSVAHK